jgi:hypothetical protein
MQVTPRVEGVSPASPQPQRKRSPLITSRRQDATVTQTALEDSHRNPSMLTGPRPKLLRIHRDLSRAASNRDSRASSPRSRAEGETKLGEPGSSQTSGQNRSRACRPTTETRSQAQLPFAETGLKIRTLSAGQRFCGADRHVRVSQRRGIFPEGPTAIDLG